MQRISTVLVALLCLVIFQTALAAPRTHVISFGKWTAVKWPDAAGQGMIDVKIRPLLVDSRAKEYTTGNPHDVTDRWFVIRRVLRVNDTLPHETGTRWQWQRGGWLLVDRATGRISQLNLPDFDPYSSTASWYRDYVAYCGLSDDGKKLYAVVAQVGRRKPVLKRALGEPSSSDAADAGCPAPGWERAPARVTFRPEHGQPLLFSVRGRTVEVVADAEGEDED